MKLLSDFLPEAVGQAEVLRAARAQKATRDWEAIVGHILAERTEADTFDHGVIWIWASGSAWAQEVRMRKDQIVARLNEVAGERGLFQDVRVSVRPLRRLSRLGPGGTGAL